MSGFNISFTYVGVFVTANSKILSEIMRQMNYIAELCSSDKVKAHKARDTLNVWVLSQIVYESGNMSKRELIEILEALISIDALGVADTCDTTFKPDQFIRIN